LFTFWNRWWKQQTPSFQTRRKKNANDIPIEWVRPSKFIASPLQSQQPLRIGLDGSCPSVLPRQEIKKKRERTECFVHREGRREKNVSGLFWLEGTHTRTSAAAQLLHGGNSPLFFYIFPVETWLENQTVGSEPDAREERCELGWNKVFSFLRKVKKIFEVCEWVLLCNQLSYNVIFAELFVLCELAIIAPSLRNVPAEMPWRESKKKHVLRASWGAVRGERRTDGR